MMDFDFIGEFALRRYGVIEDASPGVVVIFKPLLFWASAILGLCLIVEVCSPVSRRGRLLLSLSRGALTLSILYSLAVFALVAIGLFCTVISSDAVTEAGLQRHRALYLLWLCYAVVVWSLGGFILVSARLVKQGVAMLRRRGAGGASTAVGQGRTTVTRSSEGTLPSGNRA